ncbi:MAG: hypothetical protein M3N41_09240 [Acidobacteriota bacterium]|nr:hypothetical protein [Acidobacteriota bacterium]
MYFQQFYLTCLSHASYMLGSAGVASVVDPAARAGFENVTNLIGGLDAWQATGLAVSA